MLDLLVSHRLLVSLLEFFQLLLVNPFRLVLAVTLAKYLDLKGLLMGVLSHHALQFEGISIELHGLLCFMIFNKNTF